MQPLDAPLDADSRLLPDDQLAPKSLGKSREGAVIRSRAEAPAAEHFGDLRVGELAPDLVDDLAGTISDHGDALDRVAQQAEPLREPVRVGVQREPAQQLVPDGDNARSHRR